MNSPSTKAASSLERWPNHYHFHQFRLLPHLSGFWDLLQAPDRWNLCDACCHSVQFKIGVCPSPLACRINHPRASVAATCSILNVLIFDEFLKVLLQMSHLLCYSICAQPCGLWCEHRVGAHRVSEHMVCVGVLSITRAHVVPAFLCEAGRGPWLHNRLVQIMASSLGIKHHSPVPAALHMLMYQTWEF